MAARNAVHDERANFNLPAVLKSDLESKATARGMTVSEAIREAIREWLAKS